jgi:hypothetical protein
MPNIRWSGIDRSILSRLASQIGPDPPSKNTLLGSDAVFIGRQGAGTG